MRTLLVSLVFVGACSAPEVTATAPEALTHQDAAVAMVWACLGATDLEPPRIDWVDGDPDDGECPPTHSPDGTVSRASKTLTYPSCGYGRYYPAADLVALVRQDRAEDYRSVGPLAASYLAHELLHAMLYKRTGDGDEAHKSSEWHYDTLGRCQVQLGQSGM